MKKPNQNQNISTVGATSSRPTLQRHDLREQKGITLIALVITIIVLLILAGVTIAMLTGENGILKYSKTASERYSEESAREKLEVKLAEMQTEKIINKEEYNENEYLTEQLSKAGFGVSGNIVIVDGWQFQIDRSAPKIAVSLGKGVINEGIQIELSQEVAVDFTKSTVTIKVTPTEEITSILLNGEEARGLMQEDGTITKEVTENITCTVIAKNTEDNYNMNSIAVTEITEDMEIWNKEDLVAFSSKVNEGRTYEGKTVKIMSDIDFEGTEEDQYITAGSAEKQFKGNIEGNNKTISNLYINSTSDYQGLIGYATGSKISNLTMENPKITGNDYVGGITGYLDNGKITDCITSRTTTSNIIGANYVGGISGFIDSSTITNCGNNADINATVLGAGGITGYNITSEITGVYNKGNITGGSRVGGILGGTFNSTEENITSYSYNLGNVTGTYYVGGICGSGMDYYNIYNSYNLGNIKSTSRESGTSHTLSGGIVGRLKSHGKALYCYNLGTVINTGGGGYVGGIVGQSNAYNGSIVQELASITQYCYNSANVVSNGNRTGGICGSNEQYCYVKDCYSLSTAIITKGTETSTTATATNNTGSSSNYLGKIVGYAYSTSATYISGNGILEEMPTVYHVVNGLSDGDSEYWSKSNLNAPKLLWEEQ